MLANLSSCISLVGICENVTFRVSYGNLKITKTYLSTYLCDTSDISDSCDGRDSIDSRDSSDSNDLSDISDNSDQKKEAEKNTKKNFFCYSKLFIIKKQFVNVEKLQLWHNSKLQLW